MALDRGNLTVFSLNPTDILGWGGGASVGLAFR